MKLKAENENLKWLTGELCAEKDLFKERLDEL